MRSFKEIRDYGFIGNLETCALIGRDGSIDWLSFPYIESPSVFGALLDVEKGGTFSITPLGNYDSVQAYISNTNILQTIFYTAQGVATITDFMPIKGLHGNYPHASLLRKIYCNSGRVLFKVNYEPCFDYARAGMYEESDVTMEKSDAEAITKMKNQVITKYKGETLSLYSPMDLNISSDRKATGILELSAGGSSREEGRIDNRSTENSVAWFVLQYGARDERSSDFLDQLLSEVKEYWLKWVHAAHQSTSISNSPWRSLLIRSGLALKLLTNPDTGAIAAAATTSLPERIGGVRNWDYRYAWIRDSSFTVQALYHLGHDEEVDNYRRWIEEVIKKAKKYSQVYIMYGIHSESDISESVLHHLSGYKDSAPVRIGNDAVKQKQLDIFGELINAIYDTSRYGKEITEDSWNVTHNVANYVCEIWNTPDSGIWEVRGGLRHFVYSKLMCWCALDRAIKIAKLKKYLDPIQKWQKNMDDIRNTIFTSGFSKEKNSFTQALGSDALDSSSLLIPILGFLPANDQRVQGTINAIMKELNAGNGLLYRYHSNDGLAGNEGCFVLCSFWLIKALALSKRIEEAEEVFNQMIRNLSPLGLLAEEIDPETRGQLGNFPQAFGHIGLINAALYLGIVKNKGHKGPRPIGMEETSS